ncbi:MAG TPA: TIGR01212 family radical SAM protein [Candidatus Altiarchaeales archaeon]|nr:MAG: TIGR01212 family radical SAM protein [Candidatus Altiarchaeales archaeon ex4484_43]HDH41263.1 TIGR01212 family radical SAM protein [Candidatus Altiarchaeales archaeon]
MPEFYNNNMLRGEIKGIPTERRIDKRVMDQMYEEGFLYMKYGSYARRTHGCKIFKVPMNAGFTCPNWDGRLSSEGCIYCPDFARQFTYESFRRVITKDIREQVKDQIDYYKKKGAGEKALVYIAFGTNTYKPLNELKRIYDATLEHPDVIGLSIGTRPDCVPREVLDLLGDYVDEGYEIWLELGQQSVHYHTEERTNRQHGFAECIKAIKECHKRGILSLVFLILGLPYETPSEMIETARVISEIKADAVKIYPLLVMKGTRLAKEYETGGYRPISMTEYASLVADFLEHLSPYVLIQRISKDCGLDGKIVPEWNTHRFIVGPRVEKILMIRGTKQGAKYKMGLDVEELKPISTRVTASDVL